MKTSLKTAVRLAELEGKVIPHTLRHTAATWLMQRGVPIWQAAGYLGMSAQNWSIKPAAVTENKSSDGYDQIRQRAVRDAELALGIRRPLAPSRRDR